MDGLVAATAADHSTSSPSLGVIFSRPHIHLLIMADAIPFFQQMTGINMIGFNGGPVFFRTRGLGERGALLSKVMTAVAGVAFTMVLTILVGRVVPRDGEVVMLVMQLVIGGILKAGFHDQGSISRGSSVLGLVLVCAYTFKFFFTFLFIQTFFFGFEAWTFFFYGGWILVMTLAVCIIYCRRLRMCLWRGWGLCGNCIGSGFWKKKKKML